MSTEYQTIYTTSGAYTAALDGSVDFDGVRYARNPQQPAPQRDLIRTAMAAYLATAGLNDGQLAVVHVPNSGWDGSAVIAMRALMDDLLPEGSLSGACIVAELPDNKGATMIHGTITGHTPSALTVAVNGRPVEFEFEAIAVLAI